MKQYVHILFKAAGAKSARWYWAIKLGPKMYKAVKKDGDDFSEMKGGLLIEKTHLLYGEPEVERPAQMNLKYAELEEVEA